MKVPAEMMSGTYLWRRRIEDRHKHLWYFKPCRYIAITLEAPIFCREQKIPEMDLGAPRWHSEKYSILLGILLLLSSSSCQGTVLRPGLEGWKLSCIFYKAVSDLEIQIWPWTKVIHEIFSSAKFLALLRHWSYSYFW